MSFCDLAIYNDNLLLIRLYTKPWPYYRTRPSTEFWEVSIIAHLRGVWHADRWSLLLRTPRPVPLGLAYVLLVETNPFSELVMIFGLCSSNNPRYFLDFACHIRWYASNIHVLVSLANQVRRFVYGALNFNASLSYEVWPSLNVGNFKIWKTTYRVLVGWFEDLRRFSDLSGISRLGAGENKSLKS